ncbi:MAG TPA: choline-sulfatase, partial [Verrucomicrobiales bacterium]|nr:choline-sulfatase [Verrucomicrobiales bacterium]
RTEFAIKTHRAEYYALITHLDAQIGRVLTALEASGQADNTWIFFTADHGLAVGKHGLLGKQNMYEHSLRVPFLVKGPGVKPGKIEAPIYLQDVMATSLELAGGKPDEVEFQSLLPLIRGQSTQPTASPVYGAYLEFQRAILADGWKLIAYPEAKKLRLYHVSEDPEELRDLAAQPDQQTRLKDLFQQLLTLQKKMDNPLDLKVSFPEM